ncbi:hypothetical protein D3C83_06150 [compost metagenome]
MVRKVGLHVDALVAIVLLFVAAVGFIAYQRYQYSDLLEDNVNRQWNQMMLELEVARLEALLKKVAPETSAMSGTGPEQKKE